MQFMIKGEVNLRVGGIGEPPLSWNARLGVAFDDQPTACLLGCGEPPVHCIESGINSAENALEIYRGKHNPF